MFRALIAGFVLLHQGDTYGPVTTLGYYGTKERCEHALRIAKDTFKGVPLCMPDDHELVERGI